MTFYFLVFVVALASIFGIVHSQTARDTLHLQTVYEWSVEAVQQQLRKYNNSNEVVVVTGDYRINTGADDNNDAVINGLIDEIVEIIVDQRQVEGAERISSLSSEPQAPLSESVEEIQGIRIGHQNQDGDAVVQNQTDSDNDSDDGSGAENKDKLMEVINASLRRLSKAANSGRLNGTQLYEILLQETKLREKLAESDGSINENEAGQSSSTAATQEIAEKVEVPVVMVQDTTNAPVANDGPRLYFGEPPLEYVPHHRSN